MAIPLKFEETIGAKRIVNLALHAVYLSKTHTECTRDIREKNKTHFKPLLARAL